MNKNNNQVINIKQKKNSITAKIKSIKDLKPKLIFTLVYIVAVGIMRVFNLPCIFIGLFNVPCPGCGMTRAWLSVFSLDFAKAFSYHAMFWAVPVIYLYFIFNGNLFKNKKIDKIIWLLFAIGFLINWIYHLFLYFT